jgi:TRAP-type C4-dicarboxylate transport system permease small subunit
MEKENRTIRVLKLIRDFIEVYLPAALLFLMFAIFILQIIMRYVFRSPLTWSFELTLFLYVEIVLLGSCNAMRTGEHVEFTLIYEKVKPRTKTILRIMGSMITLVIFGITLPNVIYYSWFIRVASMKVTTVLKIPYKYMYIVFLYMICSMSILLLIGAIMDIRGLFKEKKAKAVQDGAKEL